MYKRNAKLINTIAVILLVLLLGILVYLIYSDMQEQKQQSDTIVNFMAEVQPYEEERQKLKSELSALRKTITASDGEAEVMVGFVVSQMSDLTCMKEKSAAYGFTPVIIIDCTNEMDFIKQVVETADKSWEIMLYATDFSAEANESVLSVLSYLKSIDREHCGVFLLRGDYSTEDNIKLLINDGFTGFTNYSDSPKAGQAQNNAIYFDYSYLTSAGTAVASRVYSLCEKKTSIILAFDMPSYNSGVLTDEYIVNLLDYIKEHTENGDCSFSTVADVVEELSTVNKNKAQQQTENDEQAQKLQERIDELDETIHSIYNKHNQ